MAKLKGKQANLDKNLFHVDNRKQEKHNPYKDEDYLEYVRHQLCCVNGCNNYSVPHHLVRKKLGVFDIPVIENDRYIKGGVVNLCGLHHNLGGIDTSTHQMGDRLFQEKFKVDFAKIAFELYNKYLKEKN